MHDAFRFLLGPSQFDINSAVGGIRLNKNVRSPSSYVVYYELPLKKGYGWIGMEISDCVRHVILELKPDWKDALTKYTPRVIPLPAEYPPGTSSTAMPRVK